MGARGSTDGESLRPAYRITATEDVHHIDWRGRAIGHLTNLQLIAHGPIDHVQIALGLPVASVEMGNADRILGLVRRATGGHFLTIQLGRPLMQGEQGEVEYFLNLQPKKELPTNFRRVIPALGFTSVDVSVMFDSRKIPSAVYWAEWATNAAYSPLVPDSQVPLELETQPNDPHPLETAYRGLENIAGKVVGIQWEW